MCNRENSSTSHFREMNCCFPFEALDIGVPNSGSLLRWNVSSMDLVLSSKHSFVKLSNCSWPIRVALKIVFTTAESAISLVSRINKFWLFSSNGFPSSSKTGSYQRANIFCKWCLYICCLVMMTSVYTCCSVQVRAFKFFNYSGNF